MSLVRCVVVLVALLAGGSTRAEDDVLVVSNDTVLDPTKTYGRIVIEASDITIDGRGAWLIGSRNKTPKDFKGVAIAAVGKNRVTLKNVNAKGWETGLLIQDGSGWTVENCNFSDNFHDPEFGWGENGRRGGIVLERVHHSSLRNNKANQVWDACVLVGSNHNLISENDFSHTSNTCLKLWNSCDNVARENNLSYGLRIRPGEVHARDSTCVLIESGSNDNVLAGNVCTHGGDGIFVRVLNGWVSTGNVFLENDVSYANNNGFEAWSPRNRYDSNTADHCSYGFWLGASDQTEVVDNSASYNGNLKGAHNSPHLPDGGHAGIVFMFGPSSHTIVRGNRCIGNNGAGIALQGDAESRGKKWKAFHWIIEDNVLVENRWGIFAKYADWIDLADNVYRDNLKADFQRDDSVTNVFEHAGDLAAARVNFPKSEGPRIGWAGEPVKLSDFEPRASTNVAISQRWDFGDGQTATGPVDQHVYRIPGFYRLGVTGTAGKSSALAWRDLYIISRLLELSTEGNSHEWRSIDPDSKVAFVDDRATFLVGTSSIRARVEPYGGGRVNLSTSAPKDASWALRDKSSLVFWIKTQNENLHGWQGPNPLVALHGPDGKTLRLTPKTDLLAQPPYNEARDGWTYFVVPLKGSSEWQREGDELSSLTAISLGFDSWESSPLTIWIDGLALE
jgi:parallel beta-helix repeat protein